MNVRVLYDRAIMGKKHSLSLKMKKKNWAGCFMFDRGTLIAYTHAFPAQKCNDSTVFSGSPAEESAVRGKSLNMKSIYSLILCGFDFSQSLLLNRCWVLLLMMISLSVYFLQFDGFFCDCTLQWKEILSVWRRIERRELKRFRRSRPEKTMFPIPLASSVTLFLCKKSINSKKLNIYILTGLI